MQNWMCNVFQYRYVESLHVTVDTSTLARISSYNNLKNISKTIFSTSKLVRFRLKASMRVPFLGILLCKILKVLEMYKLQANLKVKI